MLATSLGECRELVAGEDSTIARQHTGVALIRHNLLGIEHLRFWRAT